MTKRKRRRYTDEERAHIVTMMIAAGWPNTPGASERVAKSQKVARQTIERWAKAQQNPAPPQLVRKKSMSLADMLEDEAREALLLAAGRRDDASYQQLMTAAAIAIDKMRLLRDQSTDNSAVQIQIGYDQNHRPDHTLPAPGTNGSHKPGE